MFLDWPYGHRPVTHWLYSPQLFSIVYFATANCVNWDNMFILPLNSVRDSVHGK